VIIDYKQRLLQTSKATIPFFLNFYEEFYNNIRYVDDSVNIFSSEEISFSEDPKLNFPTHLNDKDVKKMKLLVNKYKDVFYKENEKLTFTNEVKHRIVTKNEIPVYSKSYRYPEIHSEEVDRQISKMLDQGIIVQSASPYNAPIWVVPKKVDNSNKQKWRIVVDYRKLNDNTIDDKFPIPNIEDLFGKLGNCRYFTTLDLAKGFHQIEVHPDDRHKTAFSTRTGHYEFNRMPFGLKNSPSTFQRLINNVLRDFINKICIVYLDDILIFSSSIEGHLDSINKILQKLRESNLKIQIDKCNFAQLSTKFLGHVITQGGIKPDPSKVESIKNIPLPKSQKEIRSFLGVTGFYRKFIKDYSKIAYPLIKYLKKNSKINSNDGDFVESFEKLKTLLTTEPILKNPDFSKKFTLTTDASNFALGAVLSQNNHPIAYASRTLNDHEIIGYPACQKELLAIVWAVKHFHTYLYGRHFMVECDHKPLVWLTNLKTPSILVQRWIITLIGYTFTISYIKGKNNVVADGLSRLPCCSKDLAIKIQKQVDTSFLQFHNEIVSNNDEICNEEIMSTAATIHSADEDDSLHIKITEKPVNLFKNQIFLIKSNCEKVTTKIINKKCQNFIYATEETDLLEKMKRCLIDKGLMCVFCEDKELYLKFQDLYIKHFALNRNLKMLKSNLKLQDISDKNKIIEIIKLEHLRNNHRGISEVFQELKTVYYFPNMKEQIQKFINNCETCTLAKHDRAPLKLPFQITRIPTQFNDVVHMDIWYPCRNVMYITMIDTFSKHATIHKLKDRNWISILNALKERLIYLGKMKILITDNETCIIHSAVEQFLVENEIEFYQTTPGNKTGNSDVERLHGTLNEHLRILEVDNPEDIEDLDEKIFKILLIYNRTIHSTTKQRPIDFITKNIPKEEIEKISKALEEQKKALMEKLNRDRPNNENLHENIVKNRDIAKRKPKYKKLKKFVVKSNHIIDTNNKRKIKYCKNQRKRKYKFQ
jgi:hypothetical protein